MTSEIPSLDTIFCTAVAIASAEDRVAYIAKTCGSDCELRGRVEKLVQAHFQAGSFLEQPAEAAGATSEVAAGRWVDSAATLSITEGPGTRIGPYKLLQQIGEGGMGVVYMAEQEQPVRRKVALKIIKPGMDSAQVIARFEAERQALALMDHQNIARVLDAGTTASGRPYFVMELVKGVPITRFCDENHLTPRERLELFVPICQAIQHAHQKGIIHRDVKPSNIMVTLYDGKPVPKVIDFGVAKAIEQRLTDRTLFTQFGQVVGTVEYMSPEQAEPSALDIDTRSDIYSLGVLLYELLTGSTPLEKQRLRKAAFHEMLRIIREEEPPRPSTRLSASKDRLASISAQRKMEPAKLTKLVRGELDWIVMKALEKDRGRRYETANGFARDVQRYLADEPVEACPPSTTYKLRKFARKNKKALVTAGAFVVLLGAAALASTWLAIRAMRAEAASNASADQARLSAEEAEHNAQQARAEATAKTVALKAEQQARADETKARQQAFAALRSMTDDVVERKFAQSAMLTEDDRAFLRGVIAQFDAFAAIKGDDVDSRLVRAEGRWRVGTMRLRLSEHKEAEQDFDQALTIQKQLAADFPSRPEFREYLARIHNNRGILLNDTGRPREAEKDFDQALTIYKQLAADFPSRFKSDPELARIHNNRGNLLRDTGRPKEAEKDYDQALTIYKQLAADFPTRPEFRQKLALSHDSRGNLLSATGRLKEAEQNLDQALSIRKQLATDFPTRPEFRRDLARSYLHRGTLLMNTGRPKEAERDEDQALTIYKQLTADFPSQPRFRQELATAHNNRGNLLSVMGRPKEAEQDYDQAVSIRKQLATNFSTRTEFRRDLARGYLNRGSLLSNTGRPKEAEQDFDQALIIYKQLAADFATRPEFRRDLAICLNNRGIVLRAMGRPKEAELECEQVLNIQKQLAIDFPDQPDLRNELARTCVNLAALQARQGNWAAAKRLLLEGRPHHLAALQANPRHPFYRRYYFLHLNELTRVHAGLLEQKDAVRTAETCRDLGWYALMDAYKAACFLSRCLPIVSKHEKLDAKQRNEAVQFYGDAAMKLLREAVSKGYKDVAHVKKDADLDPLRQREDFRTLVAELEGKGK